MTRQQELNLELISLARHNDLKGVKIAEDLKANSHLWLGAYGFFRGFVGEYHLIPLRDMQLYWHIDSIGLTCKTAHLDELLQLIKTWNPSNVYCYEDMKDDFIAETFFSRSEAEELIEVWWD